jgi:hypothetical protein
MAAIQSTSVTTKTNDSATAREEGYGGGTEGVLLLTAAAVLLGRKGGRAAKKLHRKIFRNSGSSADDHRVGIRDRRWLMMVLISMGLGLVIAGMMLITGSVIGEALLIGLAVAAGMALFIAMIYGISDLFESIFGGLFRAW